jgi:hypothetical protein
MERTTAALAQAVEEAFALERNDVALIATSS